MARDFSAIIKEATDVIQEAERTARMNDDSHYAKALVRSAIDRLAPPGSTYRQDVDTAFTDKNTFRDYKIFHAIGVLRALRSDYEHERILSAFELEHASLFGDFLEQARHLLTEGGFHVAAAVLAGSTLEAHIRALCEKFGVSTVGPNGPLKTSTLNDQLPGKNAYSKGDQKEVGAWLTIRNDAAHGHPDKFTKEQVALMIDGVRDFILRTPA